MTPNEVANLANRTPDARPAGFGLTFFARDLDAGEAHALLERIRQAWEVIARWGRWCDGVPGGCLDSEDGLAGLPGWLREALEREPSYEVENWLDGLHDREWIWWSGAALGRLVKIDLSAEAMPVSTWPILFVIEKAGGSVVYRGDWIPSGNVAGPMGSSV